VEDFVYARPSLLYLRVICWNLPEGETFPKNDARKLEGVTFSAA
jgi:hypothetical protein